MNRRWFVKLIDEYFQIDLVPITGMRYHGIGLYPLDVVMQVGDVHPA